MSSFKNLAWSKDQNVDPFFIIYMQMIFPSYMERTNAKYVQTMQFVFMQRQT